MYRGRIGSLICRQGDGNIGAGGNTMAPAQHLWRSSAECLQTQQTRRAGRDCHPVEHTPVHPADMPQSRTLWKKPLLKLARHTVPGQTAPQAHQVQRDAVG